MRINFLQPKIGEQVPLQHKITVFVGPNNSGKSQTLKDIRCLMDRNNSPIKSPVILKENNSCFDIPDLKTIKKHFTFKDSITNVDHYTIGAINSNLFGKSNLEAHSKIVSLSIGFTVGNVYTAGVIPFSFSMLSVMLTSSKMAPDENIATFSPSCTLIAFPIWKLSIWS